MQVNNRETATILAALRLWQGHQTNELGGLPVALVDVANDAGPMLEAEEIDELCERLNTEPERRRYLAVHIDAGNDTSGNPRRGWLVYAETGDLLGFAESGDGEDYLRRAILAAERCPGRAPTKLEIDRVPRAESRALMDSGRVRVVCGLNVAYVEVRTARKFGPVKLPG